MVKGVVSMGAYGSPDLVSPDNNSDNYAYGTNYNRQYNTPVPKHNHGGLTFFIGVAVGALLFYSISYLAGTNTLKKSSVSVQASVPASVSSAIVSDSDDYLRSWAKAVVLQCLVYPDTAKFSSSSSDWKIVRNGTQCEIRSIVTARGKGKSMGTTTFVVHLYYDDLKANVVYIKIGNNVVYDSAKE